MPPDPNSSRTLLHNKNGEKCVVFNSYTHCFDILFSTYCSSFHEAYLVSSVLQLEGAFAVSAPRSPFMESWFWRQLGGLGTSSPSVRANAISSSVTTTKQTHRFHCKTFQSHHRNASAHPRLLSHIKAKEVSLFFHLGIAFKTVTKTLQAHLGCRASAGEASSAVR